MCLERMMNIVYAITTSVFAITTAALVEGTIFGMHGGLSPELKDLDQVWKKFPLKLFTTSPTFNDPKEEGLGKHRGKRRKFW